MTARSVPIPDGCEFANRTLLDDAPNLERSGYEERLQADPEFRARIKPRVEWRLIQAIIVTPNGIRGARKLSVKAPAYCGSSYSLQFLDV
jgi:hypothetical protein